MRPSVVGGERHSHALEPIELLSEVARAAADSLGGVPRVDSELLRCPRDELGQADGAGLVNDLGLLC